MISLHFQPGQITVYLARQLYVAYIWTMWTWMWRKTNNRRQWLISLHRCKGFPQQLKAPLQPMTGCKNTNVMTAIAHISTNFCKYASKQAQSKCKEYTSAVGHFSSNLNLHVYSIFTYAFEMWHQPRTGRFPTDDADGPWINTNSKSLREQLLILTGKWSLKSQ